MNTQLLSKTLFNYLAVAEPSERQTKVGRAKFVNIHVATGLVTTELLNRAVLKIKAK